MRLALELPKVTFYAFALTPKFESKSKLENFQWKLQLRSSTTLRAPDNLSLSNELTLIWLVCWPHIVSQLTDLQHNLEDLCRSGIAISVLFDRRISTKSENAFYSNVSIRTFPIKYFQSNTCYPLSELQRLAFDGDSR